MVDRTITMEEMYKKEIAEMQSANHRLMVRVKELTEENNSLRKQIEEKQDA